MSKITITINGIETLIDKDLSLNDLILQYQLDIKKINPLKRLAYLTQTK